MPSDGVNVLLTGERSLTYVVGLFPDRVAAVKMGCRRLQPRGVPPWRASRTSG
jgi:hypothetical protein